MRTPTLRFLSLLLAAVLGVGMTGAAASAAVDGPDVSGWQHPNGYTIDWSATHVGGQAEFAFVKASEGTGYTNPYFAKDFAALAANKMVRGAYHFARPAAGTANAVAQARYFISATGKLGTPGDLPPVLDLEATGGLAPADLIAWTKAFLAEAKRLTGRMPMVYASPGFWTSAMANSTAFTAYPLWVATWGPKPILAGGWKTYAFWQYTDKATVPGMPGPVDMSVFNGTLDQLRAMANLPSVAPPPAPKPTEPKPTVPTALSGSVDAAAVTLRWSAPATVGAGLTGYLVTVDGGTPVRLAATATSYVAARLTTGAEHHFTVAAVNGAGTGPAAVTSILVSEATIPVKVALSPAATTVASGTAHRLTATVTRADTGTALAGAPVTVQLSPRAGTVPAATVVKTDSAGKVTVTVDPAVTTDVTVTAGTPAVVAKATVTVTPKLDLRLSATRIKAGTDVTFTGTTSAALAGATVYRQSYYGGAWHNRGTAKVDPAGTVNFTVKPLTKSTSKYRLRFLTEATHGAATSKNVSLAVV